MNHVPFPNNFEVYFQKAMHALAAGDSDRTVGFIRKALAIQMDDELFQVCLTLLKDAGQPGSAVDLIKEHKAYLFESKQVTALDLSFITLLIDTGNLLEARKQIDQRWAYLKNNPEHAHVQNILERHLDRIESEATKRKQEKIAEVIAESSAVSDKPYYEQMRFIASMAVLPDRDFLAVCKRLLREIDIHPLLKTEILAMLLQRGIQEVVEIAKLDFRTTLALSDLKLPDETNFFLESIQVIQKLDSPDGSEKQRLQELLFLHVMFYYPFEREVFQTPERWLEAVRHPEGEAGAVPYIQVAEKGLDLLT